MTSSQHLAPRLLALACGLLLLSCRVDVEDWVVLHESTDLEDDRFSVGQGLTTQLTLAVESDVTGPFPSRSKPRGLLFLPSPGVQVADAGDSCFVLNDVPKPCTEQGVHVGGTLVDVTASETGRTEFSFLADNIEEKGTVLLQVHKLTDVTFHIRPVHGPFNVPRLFGGSVTTIQTDFEGEDLIPLTRIRLPGTAPLEVVRPVGTSAQLRGNTLTLGPGAALYEVKSVVLPKVLSLRAYDVSEIRYLTLKTPRTARVNSIVSLEVTPLDESGNSISGTPPSPFKLEITGASVNPLSQREYQAVFSTTAVGVLTLRVSWGSASAEVQVEITP